MLRRQYQFQADIEEVERSPRKLMRNGCIINGCSRTVALEKAVTFDQFEIAWHRELALTRLAGSRRRRSQRLRAQNVALEELIIPDEIHDLLRWSDWIRAYCATAESFDRRLAASGERQ